MQIVKRVHFKQFYLTFAPASFPAQLSGLSAASYLNRQRGPAKACEVFIAVHIVIRGIFCLKCMKKRSESHLCAFENVAV